MSDQKLRDVDHDATAAECEVAVAAPGDAAEAREDAIVTIESAARTIRDEQIERALARLADRGTLRTEKRATVARLADDLTRRLVEPPKERLRTAPARGDEQDREQIAVALDLFRE